MSSRPSASKKRGQNAKPSCSLRQQLKSFDKSKLTSNTTDSPKVAPPHKIVNNISEAELVQSILNRPEIDSRSIDWSQIRITAESDPGAMAPKKTALRKNRTNIRPAASISSSISRKNSPNSNVTMPNNTSALNDCCANFADHHWTGKAWRRKSWNDHNIDPVLLSAINPFDRPKLRPDQEKLLQRAKPTTPTLNLRHLERAEALDQLNQFVQQCKARRRWIIRVITGKGILSPNEPVLKTALLRWCNDHHPHTVARWAPEVDTNGEYGGLLIQLTRQR